MHGNLFCKVVTHTLALFIVRTCSELK